MDAQRLSEIDRALDALGLPAARVAEIVARHGSTGAALGTIDEALAALAEGVAVPEGSPLDLEISGAQTRDLEAPDLALAEARTRDLPRPADDEPELVAEPLAAEPDVAAEPELAAEPLAAAPERAAEPRARDAAPSSDAIALQLDALFDDPALTASLPPAGDHSVMLSAAEIAAQVAETEAEPDDGPAVHVSDDLAALLEGEIDPSEFDAPAGAASLESPSPPLAAAADGDLASALEPDGFQPEPFEPDALEVDVELGDVEIVEDDAPDPDAFDEVEGDRTMVATPDMIVGEDEAPASPSQAPPAGEKKGFLRKMFGK